MKNQLMKRSLAVLMSAIMCFSPASAVLYAEELPQEELIVQEEPVAEVTEGTEEQEASSDNNAISENEPAESDSLEVSEAADDESSSENTAYDENQEQSEDTALEEPAVAESDGETAETSEEEAGEEEQMRLQTASEGIIDSGTCGENLTWTLSEDGVLTISGTGEMQTEEIQNAYWYNERETITSIIIEEGVTSICNGAFGNCYNLRRVSIPDTVTLIGPSAFSECSQIERLVIPESVLRIGDAAFYKCTGVSYPGKFLHGKCGEELLFTIDPDNWRLTISGKGFMYDFVELDEWGSFYSPWLFCVSSLQEVDIAQGALSIGDNAFSYGCELKSVIIPNGVEKIGEMAFYGCGNLQSVTLPKSLTTIGESVFDECDSLTNITYEGSRESWNKVNVHENNEMLNDVGVTCKSSSQFMIVQQPQDVNGYTGDTISVSVEAVGDGLTYQWYVRTSENAEWKASKCKTAVNIATLTAAADGRQLYVVVTDQYGNSVQSNIVTLHVTDLSEIDPPRIIRQSHDIIGRVGDETNMYIGAEGSGLSYDWYFNKPNESGYRLVEDDYHSQRYPLTLSSFYDGMKYYCVVTDQYGRSIQSDIITITVVSDDEPDLPVGRCGENLNWTISEDGVLTISGTGDMYNMNASEAPWWDIRDTITKIVIEDGVTSIGRDAFFGSSASEVQIAGSVKTIYERSFTNCHNLTEVVLPEGVERILKPFTACHGLKRVNIPESVKELDLGAEAFCECTSLEALSIPNGVTSIGSEAFGSCTNLTHLDIPETVTKIGVMAFSDSGLTEIVIPSGVTELEGFVFGFCANLKKITLPGGLLRISEDSFFNTTLEDVYFLGTEEAWEAVENHDAVGDATVHYLGIEENPVKIIEQPQNILGEIGDKVTLKVTAEGEGLSYLWYYRLNSSANFRENDDARSSVYEFTLGASADGMQYYCKVTDKNGNSVDSDIITISVRLTCGDNLEWSLRSGVLTISGNGAMTDYAIYQSPRKDPLWYSKASTITSIVMEGNITSIGNCAFSRCTNLTSVIIPDSVATIGEYAFSNCSNLKEIVLPQNLVSIGDKAFSQCKSLERIRIPAKVQSIGVGAFSECAGLKSLTLSEGLQSIGNLAFYYCEGLTTITIPESVTEIGLFAFSYCRGVETFSIPEKFRSGTLGPTISWELDEDGLLTISGTGAMPDYAFEAPESRDIPWAGFFPAVRRVVVGEGISRIGDSSFGMCCKLESVELPSTLKSIGGFAFFENIFEEAVIPEGVTEIGEQAFYLCENLHKVFIPGSMRSIENYAFNMDQALSIVNYGGSAEDWEQITINAGNDPLLSAERHYGAGKQLRIVSQPSDVLGSVGEKVTLHVEAEGDDLTYQWFVRASETAEWKASKCKTASNSTTLTASANGRQLYVVVTDKYGDTAQSNTVTLTVVPALKITEQPQDITGNIGDKVTLKVVAEGDDLTYQWNVRASENAEWAKSSRTKATNSTTLTKSSDGRQLYVAVTDKYGRTVESDVATLHIATVSGLKITQQPQDVTGAVGEKVTLKVVAEGEDLTYQWYVRGSENEEWKKSSRTTATNSTKLSASSEGRQLYVEVKDKFGNTVNSDVATLHLRTAELKIISQPEDVTGTIGQKITLTVVAEGEGLTYQWYVRDSENDSWRVSSCTKASNSTKLTAAADGRQLYVTVSDRCGNTVDSAIATIHVE